MATAMERRGAIAGQMSQSARPVAVSSGYKFATAWEQNAPLTEEQQAAIAALAHSAADRPMPAHVAATAQPTQRPPVPPATASDPEGRVSDATQGGAGFSERVELNSQHQFYKWFTDLESAMKSETEEKYRQYVNTLTGHLETCDEILAHLDGTLARFDDLQAQHQAVATKTKMLHDACERLVMEKERLVEFADALRTKLNYFDELENISTQFHAPTMSVGSSHFLPFLKRLDECISYVTNNPQYADSSVYLVKFKQLQSRALGMIRTHVLNVLRNASSQVQTAVKENSILGGGGKVAITEGAETSVLYVRFKAAASDLKTLMQEIENRASRKEYTQVLADLTSLYCEQRLALVKGVVSYRIAEYAKKESLPSLTRSGCAYLSQVCQLEHQLFDHFFPASASDPLNLAPLLDPLCTTLYDTLRARFIHEADLDLLCELVDILKGEVLDEQLGRRRESVAGLHPTILKTLADVQERLTFRAQTYMRDEIANYLPSAEDLDYPAKLEQAAAAAAGSEEEGRDSYSTWYPPLEKTLSCLSKLYRCLEPTIFTGLAQDAINMCSTSIQRSSKLIERRATQMDGQLFLIKHLLILREQIAPFDIDFSVTHKELDFTHLLDHLRRVLRGQSSLWSSQSLARTFSPRVMDYQIDAKKELEKNLKLTCEQFIMLVTKTTIEPLLSFMTKVTAVKVATRSRSVDAEVPKALKEQAFATPDKLAEMVANVEEAVKKQLPGIVSRMGLYLQNSSTRSILFKPIKSNILEAHVQVLTLLESDYSPEEAAQVPIMKLSDLQSFLDGLC
ncbi:conserved oligomeric Golgi complex subunit 3 [Physcomitrium patens]|uniref:Conserved oligomeric Golgi complex subunit 3 n=1 Tax=Physcomitrium patens TaxID=3218 RepID=A0A2K1JY10_PHYPA|nr:conserved oligomeric Golgi complex subunit 3-like [Physcomitrium patens]PNR46414.1 hypothetical protein PHYPA_013533 [Physcomitrium patens]|eukprot:XP_024387285.1 conserved oligomeric Golgi complex subunit 3-like [Physcomitrella patens]